MNIWSWVRDVQRELYDSDNARLADLIERLPSAAINDDNEEVEAIVPEALGLARSLGLPWVEIFVRHWRLQARNGGYATLTEAVDLLEFSHREEHRACPQSVCVVQDLARAYAGADGPGFAQERLDVSLETLGRIDPTWPCFKCISGEHVNALVDAGRPEAAVAFVEAQRDALRQVGEPAGEEMNEVDALLHLDRPQEALARLDEEEREARPGSEDSTFARWRRLRRARALLALGRAADARAAFDTLDAVVDRESAYHWEWAQVAAGLVEHGELTNDWRLGARIERHLAAQVERGRVWDAVRLGAAHADLALLRDAPATAARALGIAREQAARLRSPAAADELLSRTEAAIAAHHETSTDPALPDSPDALLEQLRAHDDRDPERELELLEAGRRRWPDAVELVETLASAHAVLGRPDAASATTRAFADEHPDDADAWTLHAFALIAARDGDAVEEVAARLEDLSPADAAWIRARWAAERDDHDATVRHAGRVVELDPDAQNARRLLARAAVHAGDHATALTHYDVLVAAEPAEDALGDHWERLVPATVLGAWDKVRASAAAVELDVEPGEGPVDEEWHTLVLRFDARDLAWAVRTGPVTARVIEVAPSTRPQHAGDRVVFDPAPVDEPEDDDGPHTFQVVETLEAGGLFTSDVDGIHPGQERWVAFRDTLRDEGWLVGALFVDGYVLDDDGVERPGLFGALALPPGLAPPEAHARLTELTADWPDTFTWLALAEASGDADAAERQRAEAARLELY